MEPPAQPGAQMRPTNLEVRGQGNEGQIRLEGLQAIEHNHIQPQQQRKANKADEAGNQQRRGNKAGEAGSGGPGPVLTQIETKASVR